METNLSHLCEFQPFLLNIIKGILPCKTCATQISSPTHTLQEVVKSKWGKIWSFWDHLPILLEMIKRPQCQSICELRKRLNFCSRLLCFFRSSDLANCLRIVSMVGEIPFIKVKGKDKRHTNLKGL